MATYYWVGGSGTWDASSTANWSLTSGGLPGIAAPDNTDTVVFDSLSGTGTCTTASGSACATATLNTSTLGLTFGANHTMSGTFTLTLGALDLGSNVLTCNVFISSNSNVRSIAFGTGNITLTGNSAFVLSITDATNLTYTGTPVVNATYAGATGTRSFRFGATGATEFNAFNINISAGTDSVSTSGLRVVNLNFTGFSGTLLNQGATIFGNLTISTGMTLNAGTAATTFAATSGTQQITTNGKTLDFPITQNSPGATVQLQDNLTMGSTRTFTLTAGTLDLSSGNRTLSTGLFNSYNSNVRTLAFGTGNITVTGNGASIWNSGTSTNLTVTGTPVVNCTYAGATGTRQVNGGGTATYSPSNPKIAFNITAGTDIFTLGGDNVYGTVNFTGFTGSYGFSASNPQFFGNLTFGTGMTGPTSATRSLLFNATSGTQTITTNGVTINSGIIVQGGSTCVFANALTMGATNTFVFSLGTVQLKNGVTSTVGNFVANSSSAKFLQSTTPGSQATLSQASGTVNVVDLNIRDINAVGGASWNAYTDFENTDAGNNDGWNFSLSPPYSTAELPVTLRPFTQPRRF